jgi:hypothetical protein
MRAGASVSPVALEKLVVAVLCWPETWEQVLMRKRRDWVVRNRGNSGYALQWTKHARLETNGERASG